MNLTPIEKKDNIFFKRDDLFEYCGVNGGKVRTAKILCEKAINGITSAGSRSSPQIKIISHISNYLGLPFNAHTTLGELGDNLKECKKFNNVNIIQHQYGYNSVIIKRAKDNAQELNYTYIPFGMERKEAIGQTKGQVKNIPFREIKRIVVPVGSGMTFCGIANGLYELKIDIPLIGISVGANPLKRLQKYLPLFYKNYKIEYSEEKYSTKILESKFMGVDLHPIYEAKCIPFIKEKDLFWIVGK